MIELSPDPDAEFSSCWKDSESFGDVSDCPALKVQLIYGINCFWRKSSIVIFLTVPRVNWLWRSSIGMGRRTAGKFIVRDGFIQLLLVSFVYSAFFIIKSYLVLLIIYFPLQKFSVMRKSHILVFERQLFELLLKSLLLLIIVRQLVHEFVHVFCDGLMLQKLIFAEVAIFNSWVNFVIGCVISVIRKKTFALVLMEAEWIKMYMFLLLISLA